MRIDRPESQEEAILLEVREPVRRFLRRILDEPAMAEDAESETMLTLIHRIRAGLELRRPISFALQVAWTKALAVQRRAARVRRVVCVNPPLPRDPARMAELKDWLESGLASLRPIERAVIHLRYSEDLSYRELAAVLGEPVGTIGRQLHDARMALKASLEKSGGHEVSDLTLSVLLPVFRTLDRVVPSAGGASLASPLTLAAPTTIRLTLIGRVFFGLVLLFAVGTGTWLLLPNAGGVRATGATRNLEGSLAVSPGVAAALEQDVVPVRSLETPRTLATSERVVDASSRGTSATVAIGGTIMDLSGEPVSGASITYHARIGERSVRATVRSDRAGRYLFERVPIDPSFTRPDAGTLEIASDGHATQLKPVGMALPRSGSNALDLDAWLARGSTLEGTVRDAHGGAPISDALVEIWMNPALEVPSRPGFGALDKGPVESIRLGQTRTDELGHYRLEHVPVRIAGIEPGCRFAPLVKMEKPVLAGGLVVSAPGRATTGALVPLATEDETVVTIDVGMPRELVLAGSVRDGRGSAVEGAEVRARFATDDLNQWAISPQRIKGDGALAATVTEAGGGWRLAGLPPLSFPARLEITAHVAGREAARLVVPAVGAAGRLPDLVLTEADPITGVVVDGGGAPIKGAVVRLMDPVPNGGASSPMLDTATSDLNGRFTVAQPHRPWSSLELRIDAPGFASARAPVGEGSNREISITLVRERFVRGTVRSAEGHPVAGAWVTAVPGSVPRGALTHEYLESHRSLALGETASDAAGAFTLGGLPPGPVALWVGVPWPRGDGLLGLLLGRKFAVVVPEPSPPGPLVVTLPEYRSERGRLVVRVVDARSKAPIQRDLTGTLVAPDGMVGGHGMFAGPGLLVFHEVPVGTYRVQVEAAGFPKQESADVKISDAASPSELRVELGRGARLVGRVKHEGARLPGTIYLRLHSDSKKSTSRRVPCGDDGAFDVDGLAPGSWRVSAELQETGRPSVMTTRPEHVVLAAGFPSPSLELVLLPTERVRLRLSGLFDEGELPTTNRQSPRYGDLMRTLGRYRLRCRDDAGVSWLDSALGAFTVETDARDVILQLPLPAGAYVVAIDRGDDELTSLRMSSPGTAEFSVPAE